MTTNKFITADKKGRELFKEYCKNNNWCKVKKESLDDYSAWDVSYFSGDTMVIGEIKIRNYNSTTFADWDYEEKKHNALQDVLKKTQQKYPNQKIEIQYINFFNDNIVNIWTTTNINKIQKSIEQKRPKTTMSYNNFITKKVYKCNSSILANEGFLNKNNILNNTN